MTETIVDKVDAVAALFDRLNNVAFLHHPEYRRALVPNMSMTIVVPNGSDNETDSVWLKQTTRFVWATVKRLSVKLTGHGMDIENVGIWTAPEGKTMDGNGKKKKRQINTKNKNQGVQRRFLSNRAQASLMHRDRNQADRDVQNYPPARTELYLP
jgi:hypothetical protein